MLSNLVIATGLEELNPVNPCLKMDLVSDPVCLEGLVNECISINWIIVPLWVECLPMVREIWVQSQVESYQRLSEWYLIPPCLTLSNIRYVSRVKWSNPGKGVPPFPTPYCRNYWKGSLLVAIDYCRQLYNFT